MKQLITRYLFPPLLLIQHAAYAQQSPVIPGKVAKGGQEVSIPVGDLALYGVLYKPVKTGKKLPAILLVHGWMPYDTNPGMEYSYPAKEFADKGFITLSVTLRGWQPTGGKDDCGYRQPKDVINALKWLAALPQVDPTRIALWGQSLGGQVVLSAAVEPLVKATVAYFPITDFRLWGVTTNHAELMKSDYIYGMCTKDGTPEDRSPLYTADKIPGAVLLMHGDKDKNVVITHSQLMHQKMLEAKRDSTLYIAKNGNHGSGGPGWENHNEIAINFLKEKLK